MITYTAAEMITIIRRECDAEYDEKWMSPAEILDKLHTSYEWMWELLLEYGAHIQRDFAIASVAGTADYDLPSDFRGALRVDWLPSLSAPVEDYVQIPDLDVMEESRLRRSSLGYARGYRVFADWNGAAVADQIRFLPTPNAIANYRVKYIPSCPKLTATTDILYMMDGRKDLVALYAALKCFDKEESAPAHLERRFATQMARTEMALELRRGGAPKRIIDVDDAYSDPWDDRAYSDGY